MDDVSIEFKKGIRTTSDASLDAKFRVLNNTERDSLITEKAIKVGHIIFHVEDNKHYFLKTYPIPGNLSGIVWSPLGNLTSDSLDSTSQNTVLTSLGANELKKRIDYTKDITTYYIDSTLSTSINSEPNNISKPYHNLSSIISSLLPDDGKYIKIYSLTEGIITGVELPFRNIIWDALTTVTYDFTGVNAIATTGNMLTRTGRIIKTLSSDASKTRNYHFVEGKVSLVSSTAGAQIHTFSAFDGKLKLSGHINTFNFTSVTTERNRNNSVIVSDIKTDLTINTLLGYSLNCFHFEEDSNIHIKILNIQSENVSSSIEQNCKIIVNTLNFTVGSNFKTSKFKLLDISNITGSGNLHITENKEDCLVNFNNCNISSSSNVYFTGGTISGNLSSLSKVMPLPTTPSNYSQRISNFVGRVNNIVITKSLELLGNNTLSSDSTLCTLLTSSGELESNSIIVESGLTIVNSSSPSTTLLSGTSSNNIIIKGIFFTNSINLGALNYIHQNNSLRGIEVQDTFGVEKWTSREIKFKNVQFDAPNKEVIVDTTTLLNILPVYSNNTSAIIGSLNLGDWYYNTTTGNIKKVEASEPSHTLLDYNISDAVKLTTNQTIGGIKTFEEGIKVFNSASPFITKGSSIKSWGILRASTNYGFNDDFLTFAPSTTDNGEIFDSNGSLWFTDTGKVVASDFELKNGGSLSTINASYAKHNAVQSYTKQQYFSTSQISTGSNIAWNLDDNQIASVTLASNATLDNPSNMRDGAIYMIEITQDGAGGRLLSFDTLYDWGEDVSAPTLSTQPNKSDILSFFCDGSKMFFMGIRKGFTKLAEPIQ